MSELLKNESLYSVIRAPHISEKAARAQEHSQYVFEVAASANKQKVKDAVEALFNVKVESVNIANVKGKVKAFKQRTGSRQGWRKAYVRLTDGQTIDVTAKP
ncbi:MAG: 50S ribosomal protein L23 [Gammaproteobacteria bacterium]|nr:MAG: 50S ribosomal protein L23 [Gammaproteobacteria bacterium]